MTKSKSEDMKRNAAWAPVFIRLALGIVFMYHGSQLLFGAFHGPGVKGMAENLPKMGITPGLFWAWMVALGQFFGGLGLLLGLLTGVASSVIVIIMLVAIKVAHLHNGFSLANHGYEYNLVLILMALSLIISGPGRLSLDRIIKWKF